MTHTDGGPAFPRHPASVEFKHKDFDLDGMSLRDYFATHAVLVPEQIAYADRHGVAGAAGVMAMLRYECADAMLAARGSAGPDFEAEREAKIEAWLERDKLATALRQIAQIPCGPSCSHDGPTPDDCACPTCIASVALAKAVAQ